MKYTILAAQSSVWLSLEHPIETIKFNSVSVLNFLEAIRLYDNRIRFYQASSSEMYGAVSELPVRVNSPMHPLSPYAVSKASAFWMIVNYREAYKLHCCTGVLFNHESYLRSSNFFVKKVIVKAPKMQLDPERVLWLGNLNVKRDFGYWPKYVEAIWLMQQSPVAKDYTICSGQSIFLSDVVYYVFGRLDLDRSRIIVSDRIPPTTQVCSDYQLLSIVVHNIIDNAVKYTNGGLVEFKVDEVENGVELTISNSGSTMPVEKKDFINLPYDNNKSVQSTTRGGEMGLLIIKEIAELIGIGIRVTQTNHVSFNLVFPHNASKAVLW